MFTAWFLFQATKNEDALNSELHQLRDQVNLKRTSMNEHVSHLDMLRDEVSICKTARFGQLLNFFGLSDHDDDGEEDGLREAD